MTGIVSYGTYIPKFRIKLHEIADVWKKDPKDIISSLKIEQKSVPGVDEDAVTIAFEAAQRLIKLSDTDKKDIGVLFVGSESHPYAVNPTSTIVGELLQIGNNYLASDMQFACKAATAALQAVYGLVESGKVKSGLAIGADCAQSKPHDALEYTSASGGCAIEIGKKNVIAEIIDFVSYSSDTPDFWRRDGIRYPSHAGRFTGEPAYFQHVIEASKELLRKTKTKPSDYKYCIFHMPNGRFPRDAAKRLGFSYEQLEKSLIVDFIGNPYSASAILGFARVLDEANVGDKIFMTSYGSGAGSDSFAFQITENIINFHKKMKNNNFFISNMLANTVEITYSQYLKNTGKF